MFGLSLLKKHTGQIARPCYKICFMQSREASFYKYGSVPDSLDGRFDLLLLHIFMVNERLLAEKGREEEAEEFTQNLFDTMFADMDQSLRESGIGDMGVPKHMKRMMLAFNGRMHTYNGAKTDKAMTEALERNLYGTLDTVAGGCLKAMVAYIKESRKLLSKQPYDAICAGQIEFAEFKGKKS